MARNQDDEDERKAQQQHPEQPTHELLSSGRVV
jgi:hypothetical protein